MGTYWIDSPAYDLYINGSFKKRYYSLKKAINIAQINGMTLWGQNHCKVVNSITGIILYQIG